MSKKQATVVLTFDEDDLQALLDAAAFGGDDAYQLKDMSEEECAEFILEVEHSATMFKEEIVETAEDACANDWLCEWHGGQ